MPCPKPSNCITFSLLQWPRRPAGQALLYFFAKIERGQNSDFSFIAAIFPSLLKRGKKEDRWRLWGEEAMTLAA